MKLSYDTSVTLLPPRPSGASARRLFEMMCSRMLSMREAAGQSVKSSVYHSWTRDTRDDRILGTRGSYAKFFQEFAGLGGDTSFYKTEAQGQIARSLFPGVVSHTLFIYGCPAHRLPYPRRCPSPREQACCGT